MITLILNALTGPEWALLIAAGWAIIAYTAA